MDDPASPTVRRRRLAAELHALRVNMNRSGETVARDLGWSPSKISRYENAKTGLRPKALIATKLERFEPGKEVEEAKACLARLKTDKVDLLQLHNVRDPNQDMAGVDALKAQGLCRYTGITSTFERDYAAAEAIIERARPDFLEVDYAFDNRKAEERLLTESLGQLVREWLARGDYDFSFSEVPYEYRKDLLAYVVIGAMLWGLTRRAAPAAPAPPAESAAGPATFDIRDGAKLARVRLDQILAVVSAGNYVEFILDDGRKLLMRACATS